MEKCERIQPNLLDYGKGLLSGPEAVEIREHIEKCDECRALLEVELAFAGRLAALPTEEPVNDVWTLIRTRTNSRRFQPFEWLTGLLATGTRRMTAAAVAVIILFAMIYSVNIDRPAQKQDPLNASAVVKWTDDPMGKHTDAVVEYIANL